MLANYDMEPIHLRAYELNYELRIRNVATDRVDTTLKRKYLKRQLKKDLARPEAHAYMTPNFVFEEEKRELDETIKSITGLTDDFDGVNVELGNRIRSRINHALGRLSRIPENINDDISNYRGDNIVVASATLEELDDINERFQQGLNPRRASAQNVVGEGAKSVPVFKWPVRFNGRSDNGSVNHFLQRVEELRVSRKCSKEGLFEAASDLFEDVALEWFRAQVRQSRFSCWDSLVLALRNDFLPRGYDEELWRQIERRTQHEEEPVIIYISIMENLFECLSEKPNEEKKIKTLAARVLPDYQSHLALQNVTTVSQLIQICRALEDSEKTKKHFRPPPRKNISTLEPGLAYNPSSETAVGTSSDQANHRNVSSMDSSNRNKYGSSWSKRNSPKQVSALQCWQCNESGHRQRDCHKKFLGPVCYGCGRKNVIKPNCPNCTKNGRKENDQ